METLNKKYTFVNSIVEGGSCNKFGYDQYVSNSDATSAYTVTIKVFVSQAGMPTKESQKIVSVPAGGKTYLGCSQLATERMVKVKYEVVGESKE